MQAAPRRPTLPGLVALPVLGRSLQRWRRRRVAARWVRQLRTLAAGWSRGLVALHTSSRLALAAEQEAVVADVPECTLGRAGGGDRCGSRLGPAMPSGVVGSSTRPAISQVSGGRLGAVGRAGGPAEAYSARTGGFTSPRAVAAAVEAAACGSKVGAAAADSGGRLVSRTGGFTYQFSVGLSG